MKKSRILFACLAALVCVGCYDMDEWGIDTESDVDDICNQEYFNRNMASLELQDRISESFSECGYSEEYIYTIHILRDRDVEESRVRACYKKIEDIFCIPEISTVVFPDECKTDDSLIDTDRIDLTIDTDRLKL